jgi:hypothetical protein
MNVFEELVEELKDEHLLEETVSASAAAAPAPARAQTAGSAVGSDIREPKADSGFEPPADVAEVEDESEYFRKRAMDQVAGLKMVEHIMTGIEREYMMVVPAAFDDLAVKKALHNFLKVTDEPDSTEHLEAEGLLICETEAWAKALAERDSEISVANVRRFCENSRPVLSSQALLALARFYRTTPASGPVRAKFDFVMTRLFSRDAGEEKRKLLFGTLEMIGHIRDLYDNWANLTPFAAPAGEANVAETLVAFRQAIDESETAESFDELIASDFFNRTRAIKESAGEIFFVPEVTAAAIECNVRVGNRFVELLTAEKVNFSVEALEEKYGYSYDSMVSGVASKTLSLAELVKMQSAASGEATRPQPQEPVKQPVRPAAAPERKEWKEPRERRGSGLFGVNRWVLAFAVLALCAAGAIYFWSEGGTSQQSSVTVAQQIGLENSGLEEYVGKAKASGETFTAWFSRRGTRSPSSSGKTSCRRLKPSPHPRACARWIC